MWGLFALEEIPAGAYVVDYCGEVITAHEADRRGKVDDREGANYLYDMIGPSWDQDGNET